MTSRCSGKFPRACTFRKFAAWRLAGIKSSGLLNSFCFLNRFRWISEEFVSEISRSRHSRLFWVMYSNLRKNLKLTTFFNRAHICRHIQNVRCVTLRIFEPVPLGIREIPSFVFFRSLNYALQVYTVGREERKQSFQLATDAQVHETLVASLKGLIQICIDVHLCFRKTKTTRNATT